MPKLSSRSLSWIIFILLTPIMVALFLVPQPDMKANVAQQAQEEAYELEGESAQIEAYFQYRFDQMKDKNDTIPDGALINALNERESLAQEFANTPDVAGISSSSWTAVGPGNVGGRVRAMLAVDASTVYVAGVAGGIW